MPTLSDQLDLLIRAHYVLLYLVAAEEQPVEETLRGLGRPVVTWDIVRGWDDSGTDKGSLIAALGRIEREAAAAPCIFVLRDIHPYLRTPNSERTAPIVRALRNLAQDLKPSRKTVILLGHSLEVPPELAEEITVIDCPLPNAAEISTLIDQLVHPEQLQLSDLAREQLVKACQGLGRSRIQRVLAKALAAHQFVTDADIDSILAEKQQAIRQTGILEFLTPQASLQQVGGLESLKQWVRSRQDTFTEEARRYGIPNPKGVLLVGIQGTGKSLSAKTIAHQWRLPLLRLDVGRLFGGLVGESESRIRQMIQLSEAVAPCVLWIDEIDKAFGHISSGSDGDSGTSRRVFGALVTWMQEKTSSVFVVATANNVQILPAELLRKGRFDEIFFLNLPSSTERQAIFRVHLQRLRPNRLREFDLEKLAWQTRDFSGAEIEQAIIDGMYRAFDRDAQGQRRDFTTEDILAAIAQTVPLAALSHDQIETLQKWAEVTGARSAST
jgi:SpoVK/Ycf46/Vps4 family AAA+-type ATPase